MEEEARVRTTREELWRWFDGRPHARVVLEVGGHSPWGTRVSDRSTSGWSSITSAARAADGASGPAA